LVQAAFQLETEVTDTVWFGPMKARMRAVRVPGAQFPLHAAARDSARGLTLSVSFDEGLYARETVQNVLRAWRYHL
jgi:hypothetical protein